MGRNRNEILYRVAEEVLEKLAFLFSFPMDDDETVSDEHTVSVGVSFSGPFDGKLIMTISSRVLKELAENMLGLEDEETNIEEQHDALKELINVICGNLLPQIAGKNVVFNMEMPTVIQDPAAAGTEEKSREESSAILALEDGFCRLHLFLDQGK